MPAIADNLAVIVDGRSIFEISEWRIVSWQEPIQRLHGGGGAGPKDRLFTTGPLLPTVTYHRLACIDPRGNASLQEGLVVPIKDFFRCSIPNDGIEDVVSTHSTIVVDSVGFALHIERHGSGTRCQFTA